MIKIYNDGDKRIAIENGYVNYRCVETGAKLTFKINHIDYAINKLKRFAHSGINVYMAIRNIHHNNLYGREVQFLIKVLSEYINGDNCTTFIKVVTKHIDKKSVKKEDLKKMSYQELITIDKL